MPQGQADMGKRHSNLKFVASERGPRRRAPERSNAGGVGMGRGRPGPGLQPHVELDGSQHPV
jgi:hypothetical protein